MDAKNNLDVIEPDVVANRLGKQRNEGILLQLERPNGIRTSATAQPFPISQGDADSNFGRQQVPDLHGLPRPDGEAGVSISKGDQEGNLAPRNLVGKGYAQHMRAAAAVNARLTPTQYCEHTIILAMHILPLRSWSATLRNRSRGLDMADLKFPCRSTSLYRFNSAVRGTRVPSNQILAAPQHTTSACSA